MKTLINKRLTKFTEKGGIIYNLIINHYDFFGLNQIKKETKSNDVDAILFISVEVCKNLLKTPNKKVSDFSIERVKEQLKNNDKKDTKCKM